MSLLSGGLRAGSSPIFFEPSGPDFLVRTRRATVEISRNGIGIFTPGARDAIRFEWLGSPDGELSGADRITGVSNYFQGAQEGWRTGVPHYSRVHARHLYSGVDLDYYFQNSELEFDIRLSPHADPAAARFAVRGAESFAVHPDGALHIRFAGHEYRLRAPVAYQIENGVRVSIECRYKVDAIHSVGFQLGAHDASRELVIDPVLELLTYLGGSGIDEIEALGADPAGNIVAAGVTNSPNFPGASAPGGAVSIFVTKLNRSGSAVVFTSILGSRQLSNLSYIPENVTSLAIDSDGSIYLAGQTFASNFPTTNGAWQQSSSGMFLARISANGDLVYSTFLGPRTWGMSAVRVRVANGLAYVAGTVSTAEFFGTSGAYQRSVAGGADFFAFAMAPDGSHPLFLTAFGGSGQESLKDMAIDGSGNIVLVGSSNSQDLPLTADALPYTQQAGNTGGTVLVRIDSAGSRLVSSTWLGASSVGAITAVPDGGVVLAGGSTLPPDLIAGAPHYSPTLGGTSHAWVAKFPPASNRPVWTSDLYSGESFTWGISSDAQGNLYWPGFPNAVSGGALAGGGTNGVAKLAADGSEVLYASPVPGLSPLPIATAAANGFLYFGGYSGAALPTTNGVFQPQRDPAPPGTFQSPLNYYDGFLGVLDLSSFAGDNFFLGPSQTGLTLSWRIGEPPPAPVTQPILFNRSPVPLIAAASSRITASYSPSPSPAVTINAATSQSAAGTFQESVQLTLPSNPNATLSLPVTLTLKPQVSFTLATNLVTIHVRQGQDVTPATVAIQPNFGSEYFSYTVNSTASWLFGSVTTSSLNQTQLTINTAQQPAGVYDGVITVGLQGLQNSNVTVQVHYVVDPPAVIQISTNQVTMHIVKGQPITPAIVNVTSSIVGVKWSVFVGVSRTWLHVTSSNNSTPGQISITVDPATVEPGYWLFNAFVSGENNQQLTLSMVIDVSSGAPLDAVPNSITYQYFRGGPYLFTAQPVQFTTPANTTVQWKTDQAWISPQSGSTKTPAQVAFVLDNTLQEGVYHGNVVANAGGASITIPVTWQLYDTPHLVYSAAPLQFQWQISGPLPPAQHVSITCPTLTPDYFYAGPQFFPTFLKVDPASTNTPATLNVTVDPTGLGPGTYQSSISIQAGGYDSQRYSSIPVTLTVVADPNASKSAVAQVVDAASYLGGAVAPGEAVVLFGAGLGPASLEQSQPDSTGFPASLSGWSVQFDEFPAPIIYVSDKQTAVMVPFGITGRNSVKLTASNSGLTSTPLTLPVTAANPGVFTANSSGSGLAAAVNVAVDGSISAHTAASPASRGGIVTIYASGLGGTTPPQKDGTLAASPLPQLNTSVRALVGGAAADILYAGPAPGQIAGLTQINLRVPDTAPSGSVPLLVVSGDAASQPGVTLAIR